jgi:uncharacterized damage-inducible protein DinB
MKDVLLRQYTFVQDSRAVLFSFCDAVSAAHFVKEVEGFGRGGSMRNLIVHVANSYRYWIAGHCMKETVSPLVYDDYVNVDDCRRLYNTVDGEIFRLISSFETDYMKDIASSGPDNIITASPFKVFMHGITHEYHHKGQMLSIARHLGYIPVDTDIIR